MKSSDLRLVLASQSPRRREILERAGFSFSVRVAGVEELARDGEAPADYALRLARSKAESVPLAGDEIALGADTIVVVDGAILEKPADDADARRMLGLLSGRWHEVLTGISLHSGGRTATGLAVTRVHFLELAPETIDAYVASGEPRDKAGAYAIQGLASKFIDRIEGCYFNVVGLPVSLVARRLAEFGFPV
jgi:septum formation protein